MKEKSMHKEQLSIRPSSYAGSRSRKVKDVIQNQFMSFHHYEHDADRKPLSGCKRYDLKNTHLRPFGYTYKNDYPYDRPASRSRKMEDIIQNQFMSLHHCEHDANRMPLSGCKRYDLKNTHLKPFGHTYKSAYPYHRPAAQPVDQGKWRISSKISSWAFITANTMLTESH